VKDLILKYTKLFEDGEKRISNLKAHITPKQQAKPVFWRAASSICHQESLEDKLDTLEREGMVKVDHSSWDQ